MSKLEDRIAALEKLLAPAPERVAFAAPAPDLSHEQWQEIAMRQQAELVAVGQAHMDAVDAREAERKAAELAAQHPPKPQPKRKAKPPPVFTPATFLPART